MKSVRTCSPHHGLQHETRARVQASHSCWRSGRRATAARSTTMATRTASCACCTATSRVRTLLPSLPACLCVVCATSVNRFRCRANRQPEEPPQSTWRVSREPCTSACHPSSSEQLRRARPGLGTLPWNLSGGRGAARSAHLQQAPGRAVRARAADADGAARGRHHLVRPKLVPDGARPPPLLPPVRRRRPGQPIVRSLAVRNMGLPGPGEPRSSQAPCRVSASASCCWLERLAACTAAGRARASHGPPCARL